MATTLARMNQLIGTTADWGANDIVLGEGEIGLEVLASGLVTAKVGDGVSTFSNLAYSFGANASVGINGDQEVNGVKSFTSDLQLRNQTTITKFARLLADDPAGLLHSLILDSNEVQSNAYLVARDASGNAQSLAASSDTSLYWNNTRIADSTGLSGVIWGAFDDTGVLTRGTGFSVSRPATGQYDLVFDEASIDNLSQSVVACENAPSNKSISCAVQMTSSTTCTIWTSTAGDVAANSDVSFIRNYIPPENPIIVNARNAM